MPTEWDLINDAKIKAGIHTTKHYHPELNIVQGIDVTKVLPNEGPNRTRNVGQIVQTRLKKSQSQIEQSQSKPAAVSFPLKIDLRRARSESVGSEGDPGPSPLSVSPPIMPSGFGSGSPSGLLSSAFAVRPHSGDASTKVLKHEFDFINK